MRTPTTARQIADLLGLGLIGPDVQVTGVSDIRSPTSGSLVFLKKADDEALARLSAFSNIVAIVPKAVLGRIPCTHMVAERPRLAFAKAVQAFFAPPTLPVAGGAAIIDPAATLGSGVLLGSGVVIGPQVEIGDEVVIQPNVIIESGTRIGSGSVIKSSTVIGQAGFGFAFDEDGTPVRLPHLGRVIIGAEVEVGALNTVVRATLGDTVLEELVKTDDHVHIAHNCRVGRASILTACAELSGSVTLEERVWLGPNCSILNGITIGRRAMVGIGAVVTKNVSPNALVVGNPARFIRERRIDE